MPEIGRFISPDTIVPEPGNPQSYNRYAYVRNNPMNFTDPTGHRECITSQCDLVWNELAQRPAQSSPLPPVIEYFHQEMTRNAVSTEASVIRMGNSKLLPFGETTAYAVWTSQVMDAKIKSYAGPLSPYLANWDHKPLFSGEGTSSASGLDKGAWATVGDMKYRFDTWSNAHYGYVGAAAGFSDSELIDGAGLEQVGTNIISGQKPQSSPGAPSFLSSWDEPSDTASIQLGISLWQQYGLNVTPADFYLAVLNNTSDLQHKK